MNFQEPTSRPPAAAATDSAESPNRSRAARITSNVYSEATSLGCCSSSHCESNETAIPSSDEPNSSTFPPGSVERRVPSSNRNCVGLPLRPSRQTRARFCCSSSINHQIVPSPNRSARITRGERPSSDTVTIICKHHAIGRVLKRNDQNSAAVGLLIDIFRKALLARRLLQGLVRP